MAATPRTYPVVNVHGRRAAPSYVAGVDLVLSTCDRVGQRLQDGTSSTIRYKSDLARLPGQGKIGIACLAMSSTVLGSCLGKLGRLAYSGSHDT